MLRGLAWSLVLLCPTAISAQNESFPVILGRSINLLAPAVGGARATVVFGSAITPEGATPPTVDLYAAGADGSNLRRLTRLAGQGATAASVSADGSRAAFTALSSGSSGQGEEVHVVDMASATDRTVAVDTQGCIQPLCAGCFFTCLNTPHISPDGAAGVYQVNATVPFGLRPGRQSVNWRIGGATSSGCGTIVVR
jgi:Tol biopolymer transport system component